MEVESPMASLYLLGNPDHYTSHSFVNFYWKDFVKEVQRACESDDDDDKKVVVGKADNKYVPSSGMLDDYIFWPHTFEDVCLYDWV